MRAMMKDNLILRYQTSPDFDYRNRRSFLCRNELMAVRDFEGWLEYFETKEFLKSIEGKIVNLVFTAGDAFEEKDNNYWLPNDLWEAI